MYFPDAEGGPVTKLEVVEYWAAVAEAALHGCRDRPEILHRFPAGVADDGEGSFYQKRIPKGSPEWVLTATVMFPSGRTAAMPVMADEAALVWAATLGCLECNPWPVRADDVAHPDELRVDLDPTPGVPWDDVRRVALMSRDVLAEHGTHRVPEDQRQTGPPHQRPGRARERLHGDAARGAGLAREVERRMPGIATTAWWKEERQGVFLDYNQNARDRTVASAYSVRPMPDARVSTPLDWEEVAHVDPSRFTVRTVPDDCRSSAENGELGLIEHVGTLAALLALAEHDAAGGLGDAPWPPHFPKGDDEPVRVTPLERRKIDRWEEMKRQGLGGARGQGSQGVARNVAKDLERRSPVRPSRPSVRATPAARPQESVRRCSSLARGRLASGRSLRRDGTARTAPGRS